MTLSQCRTLPNVIQTSLILNVNINACIIIIIIKSASYVSLTNYHLDLTRQTFENYVEMECLSEVNFAITRTLVNMCLEKKMYSQNHLWTVWFQPVQALISCIKTQARTGPAGYWEIPGGPVASKTIMIQYFAVNDDIINKVL